MLISEVPEIAAHHAPDKIALRYLDRAYTFAEMRDRCWRLSNALLPITERGDRVAILAENCPEYTEAYYGVPGAALALCFLNYRLSPRELTYIIGDSAPSVLLVQTKYLDTIRGILPDLPSVKTLIVIGDAEPDAQAYEDFIAGGAPTKPSVTPDFEEMAWLLYTSGTTGLPKGAMLSHKNLMGSINNAMSGGAEPDEVCLFAFPQFHVAGYVMPMYHLRRYEVVLLGAFDVVSMLENVQKYRITATAMAPTMVAMILESNIAADYDLSSLRQLGYGASAMPGEVIRKARGRLPKVGFGTGFGMTELAGNVMGLSRDDHERAAEQGLDILRSVGKQMPLSRVKVIREDGTECDPDEPGEIVVKGDQVLKGYWNKPEATRDSFIDGWFRTGDVGRFDKDKYLYIVDRKKDMILSGGENIYPREVEEILFEHPAVADAAVIGTPDAKWGESVTAVVRLAEGASLGANELIDFCRPRIAGYKKPKYLVLVDELPRNASGKVLKRELREAIARGDLVFAP